MALGKKLLQNLEVPARGQQHWAVHDAGELDPWWSSVPWSRSVFQQCPRHFSPLSRADGDAVGKHALDGSSVECGEDEIAEMCSSQPCPLFTRAAVFCDQVKSSVIFTTVLLMWSGAWWCLVLLKSTIVSLFCWHWGPGRWNPWWTGFPATSAWCLWGHGRTPGLSCCGSVLPPW